MVKSVKVDIQNPFIPLKGNLNIPAHKRIVSTDIQGLVNEYSIIRTEMKRLGDRRAILRPKIVELILKEKTEKDEDGNIVAVIGDKEITISPRNEYIIRPSEAVTLLEEKGLLDKVAKKVLLYKVKPSWSQKLARRFYELLEKLGISTKVEIDSSWEFNEDKIQELWEIGTLTDSDIDYITEVKPKGNGYALYVDHSKEEEDNDEG